MGRVITFTILIIVLLVAFEVIKSIYPVTVTDTVLKTERVQYCSSSGCSSKYLVFGKKETYQDTDSLFYWKFNSSDVYGQIQSGRTYTFKVIGWRVPFLSWYRNIISV